LEQCWQLLETTSLGETDPEDSLRSFGEEGRLVYRGIKQFYPDVIDNYVHARQQEGTLKARGFNFFYRVITYTSYVALAIFVWWWLRQKTRELAAAGGLLFLALSLNALVFGALSGPFGRYQARMAWVATFFVLVGVVKMAMNPVTYADS
jgi:hypothetical protein